MLRMISILGVSAGLIAATSAGDWPQWRGPNGDGLSREKGWRTEFGEEGPPKLWTAKVGRGFSSPVIRGDRVYIFGNDADSFQGEGVLCLDRLTGKEIWKFNYQIASIKRSNNPAGSTPTATEDRLFCYGAGLNLHALDLKTGKPVWSVDVMKELPGQPTPYGFHISPLVYKDVVIVAAIQHTKAKPANFPLTEPRGGAYVNEGGVLLAYDAKTGREVWRNTEGASAWSSPVLATFAGQPTLIHQTGRYLLGVDPANGTTRWKTDLRELDIVAEDMAASPVVSGNTILTPIHKAYGSTASGTAGAAAFEIVEGKPKLLWKNKQWCHWFQSASIWDERVYAYDERNTFWCFELKTGKELWKSKELGSTGNKGGGFMIADGKMLSIDARQNLFIADLKPDGAKILHRTVIFKQEPGYECETAPLLLDGLLYCRNHSQMICFDFRAKK